MATDNKQQAKEKQKFIPLPSQARLKELFDYNEETGELSWKIAPHYLPYLLGQVAGSNSHGYRVIRIDGTLYKAHRLIWMFIKGQDPEHLTIDHINHNPSDNRIENLRLATQQEQSRYRPNAVGAYIHRPTGRYRARIRIDGRLKSLGLYNTLEEASAVYHAKAREVFGEFYCEPTVSPTDDLAEVSF